MAIKNSDLTVFRELTTEQMEKIVGGASSTEDEIYHMGTVFPIYPDDVGGYGMGGGGSVRDELSSDSDNPIEDTSTPQCGCNDSTDSIKDAYAMQAATTIMQQQDWQSKEYSAVIFRNADGSVSITALTKGDGGSTDLKIPGSVNISQIIGFIHNHPIDTAKASKTVFENQFPSDADWLAAKDLVSAGANKNQLSIFILDGAGILREYSYSQKSIYYGKDVTNQIPQIGRAHV